MPSAFGLAEERGESERASERARHGCALWVHSLGLGTASKATTEEQGAFMTRNHPKVLRIRVRIAADFRCPVCHCLRRHLSVFQRTFASFTVLAPIRQPRLPELTVFTVPLMLLRCDRHGCAPRPSRSTRAAASQLNI